MAIIRCEQPLSCTIYGNICVDQPAAHMTQAKYNKV